MRSISKFEVDLDALEYVEDEVGIEAGAWDMIDPLELITASINYFIKNKLEAYLKEYTNG